MAECRACLVNNVKMHDISTTRYREIFEKLSGNKLSIEDGRPETICFICNSRLERFWRFFEISQKAERIFTHRLLFGNEMGGTLDAALQLTSTPTKSLSLLDDGTSAEPEVTVTVKEEPQDMDDWELFQHEFMDSPGVETKIDEIQSYLPDTEMTTDTVTKMADIETNMTNKETKFAEMETNMADTDTAIRVEHKESKHELLEDIKMIKTENMDYEIEETQENPAIVLQQLCKAIEQFPLKADMKYHPKQNVDVDAFYHCSECDYRCQHAKTLRKHSKYHDPNNQFSCAFCLYRFADEKKLASHKNYCTVCNICGKKFHNLNGLRTHVRLHTGEQPFSCDLCGRGFNQKTNLQTHLRVHAREKQYPCEVCHKIFPFSSYLKRHMLIHSGNQLDGESIHRTLNCHKLFSRKKKNNVCICTVCGKSLRKDSMSMHLRLHTGERPFSCEKCNRCFNQKCNLLTHIERVHAGDDLFSCKVCFKTFASHAELTKHAATHGLKIEIKQEMLVQSQKTIDKFVSDYDRMVDGRVNGKVELSETDRKMELILNLGLTPRIVEPGETNKHNNVIVQSDVFSSSERKQGTKRRCDMLEAVKAEYKLMKIERVFDKHDSLRIIKEQGLKHDSLNYLDESNHSNKVTEQLIKCRSFNNLEHTVSTDTNAKETVATKEANAENDNDLTQDEDLVSQNKAMLTEYQLLPPDSVSIKIKSPQANEIISKLNGNLSIEEAKLNNDISDDVNGFISNEDIEYFDDSIEIIEVELSDNERQNSSEIYDEEDYVNTEDLEVAMINPEEDSYEIEENQQISNEEALEISEDTLDSNTENTQVSLEDEDAEQIDVNRQTAPYAEGFEVSVIDPDDVDDSEDYQNSEEEYLDLSDTDLDIESSVNRFDKIDPTQNSLRDSDSERIQIDHTNDEINSTDIKDHLLTDTPQKNKFVGEAKIKIRSDLFLEVNAKLTIDNLDIPKEGLDNGDNFDADIEEESNGSIDGISAREFEVFHQKHIFSIHRHISPLFPNPYQCDICKTKVFSY